MGSRPLLGLIPVLGLALVAASDREGEREYVALLQHELTTRLGKSSSLEDTPAVEHYWPGRGHDPAMSSSVPYMAPSDLSTGPSWVWKNDLKEQVRFSPLIDANKNIYIATTTRIRQLSSDGDLLWTWQMDPRLSMNVCPVLHGSSVLALVAHASNGFADPALVSINMKNGVEEWRHVFKGRRSSGDAKALRVYKDTVYFGMRTHIPDGSDTVLAVNASDGQVMWDYVTDSVCWNFSPAVDDGGVTFSGVCGSVYRLSLQGKLLWRAGPSKPPGTMCGPTGGALGPNGLFYAEYNEEAESMPRDLVTTHPVGSKLAAYRVADGSLAWQKSLEYRAAQYPAVGKLGPEGPLAVLVPMGDQPRPPLPKPAEDAILLTRGPFRNMVLALDAETGAKLWMSEDRPYHSIHGAGERDEHNVTDGSVCYPDAQGVPVVAGDGTVYASSSHHGDLTAIRDKNGDGILSPDEVSIFRTGKCFLNSPSIAPGMLVAAPCWGSAYIFKS